LALPPTNPDNSKPVSDREAIQQDAFMREVDDALREQEMFDMFKRYGKPIGGLVAVGLLALAGYLGWKDYTKGDAAEQSEKLALALDRVEAGNAAGAAKDLDALIAEGGTAGVSARLTRAGVALQQGRAEEAAREFAAVAADSSAPQPFRDLATVREVAIRFDRLAPQQVIDKLKPLAVPGNPWFGSAGELTAMAHLKMGKKELAGPLFVAIARNKDTPDSLKSRARQMAGLLGYDAIDDVAKAAGIQDDAEAEAPAPPAKQETAKQ
jgi:hypothetical protein